MKNKRPGEAERISFIHIIFEKFFFLRQTDAFEARKRV